MTRLRFSTVRQGVVDLLVRLAHLPVVAPPPIVLPETEDSAPTEKLRPTPTEATIHLTSVPLSNKPQG